MSRRNLRPQLNQIRGWVRQGRTDAWIAHQLEVPVVQLQAFKAEFSLDDSGEAPLLKELTLSAEDLRARDDAMIASELDAEEAQEAKQPAARTAAGELDPNDLDDEQPARPGRSRSRQRSRGAATTFEATFEHGDEGYGLWLDPAIADDTNYKKFWAGHGALNVAVEADRIVLTRNEDA